MVFDIIYIMRTTRRPPPGALQTWPRAHRPRPAVPPGRFPGLPVPHAWIRAGRARKRCAPQSPPQRGVRGRRMHRCLRLAAGCPGVGPGPDRAGPPTRAHTSRFPASRVPGRGGGVGSCVAWAQRGTRHFPKQDELVACLRSALCTAGDGWAAGSVAARGDRAGGASRGSRLSLAVYPFIALPVVRDAPGIDMDQSTLERLVVHNTQLFCRGALPRPGSRDQLHDA